MVTINDTTADDGMTWNERVTNAVHCAAEHIHALPQALRGRALAMLVASCDRELKPLQAGRWKAPRHSRNFARNDG